MSDGAASLDAPLAVLFDLDGTLLDTNYLHTLAWWRALTEAGNGVPMSALRDWSELTGFNRLPVSHTGTATYSPPHRKRCRWIRVLRSALPA